MIIKEAFETIKLHKGITKPKGFVYDDDPSSMRPNPSRFDTDDEENMHKHSDYRMYQERAESSEDYEHFRGTFKTLNDITDIKIRVEKGEMKDSTSRFKLDELRASISKISGSGASYFIFIAIGVVSYIFATSRAVDRENKSDLYEGIDTQEKKQIIKRKSMIR